MLKSISHAAMVSLVVLVPAVVSLSKPAEADGRPMCAERQERHRRELDRQRARAA